MSDFIRAMFSFFKNFKRPDPDAVLAVYRNLVAQARSPFFYAEWGVPDTVDGRFDLISLHAILLFHRFASADKATQRVGQAVFDLFFLDMDQQLREMGVSDVGVPKKIKKMAQAFYGRAAAYRAAFDQPPSVLKEAFIRNIFLNISRSEEKEEQRSGEEAAACLTWYSHTAHADLAEQEAMALSCGHIIWPTFDACPGREILMSWCNNIPGAPS